MLSDGQGRTMSESGMGREVVSRTRFTQDEDEKMLELITEHGLGKWTLVSQNMGERTARQCRERYNNYLSPELKHGDWTSEEDARLVDLYAKYDANWNLISQQFKGRSRISLRNRHALLRNTSILEMRRKSESARQEAVLTSDQTSEGDWEGQQNEMTCDCERLFAQSVIPAEIEGFTSVEFYELFSCL